ncbi:MAG: hypothetical protein LBE37_13270 [Sphingobacterium sp.]|nr:hypothetical protein [Sphingobacterium sp.]
MRDRTPIPCPECDREKYFEGLCYACSNRKVRESYESMSDERVQSTVQNIIQNIETINKWEQVYKDFTGLFAYRDINTREIADAAFRNKIYNPATLYRDASPELESQLIALINDPYCSHAGDILSCLSVIGSDNVKSTFYQLEKNPLPWRKNLYVDPSFYAEQAGWTFGADGTRIQLNYHSCYSLIKESREDKAVLVAQARAEECAICSCQTVDILSLDGKDQRLSFLDLPGQLNIPICPNCASMCDRTIVRYQLDGESTFEVVEPYTNERYISDADFASLVNNKMVLSLTKKPAYFACGNDDVSTIGGNPDWIQDWQYENCPDCQKKMKLLGAIQWDQLIDASEGTLYIEICTDCSVVVAIHQQT